MFVKLIDVFSFDAIIGGVEFKNFYHIGEKFLNFDHKKLPNRAGDIL